ncbi:MAG: hypothetical protein OEZ13_09760 [Spirochaetia bacterium]|nr:hypothetical protein [Spirochaetia bacterium]
MTILLISAMFAIMFGIEIKDAPKTAVLSKIKSKALFLKRNPGYNIDELLEKVKTAFNQKISIKQPYVPHSGLS